MKEGLRPIIALDYDGPIADSFEFLYETFKDLWVRHKKTDISRERFRKMFDGNFYHSLGKMLEVDYGKYRAFVETFKGRIRREYHQVPFTPVAKELEEISKVSQLEIITSNEKYTVENHLSRLGTNFDFNIHGSETMTDSDGKEREIGKVHYLRRLRRSHPESKVSYVCDTVGDIHAAFRAEVEPIGVSWGYHSGFRLREVFRRIKIMHNVNDLMAYINQR